MFKRLILIFIFLCGYNIGNAIVLSKQTQISLLTCAPSDREIYTLYGHSAIRICDPQNNLDVVFNYGIFDFSKPNFIYRFAKGETDYKLEAVNFKYFCEEQVYDKRKYVCEQVLNLTDEEKENIYNALVINLRPENKVYRYNFFFDNCATRPAVMFEKKLQNKIIFDENRESLSFRDAINYCTRNHPWVQFGCDIVLGIPTDRKMTFRESFFLPEKLKEAYGKAKIERDGIISPLIAKETIILEDKSIEEPKISFFTSPLFSAILFFFVIATITYYEYSIRKYFRIVDCILFFIAGCAGCILFFLSFISVHPCTFPNLSLIWLHPLHLVGVIFFAVKKFKFMAFWYHFINFVAILTMFAGWIFIPQHFNMAFVPLIASLVLRSGWAIYRKRKYI